MICSDSHNKFSLGCFRRALLLLVAFAPLCCALGQTATYRLIHQGNSRFRAQDYEGAEQCYLEALKVNPNSARATFNLADVYLAKGNVRAADSLFHQVVQGEKNAQVKSMAWHNRGVICQTAALQNREKQQELLQEAIRHYKAALRLNPHADDTRYNLALCQAQLKKGGGGGQQQQQQKQQQQEQQQQEQQDKQQDKPKEQPERDRKQTEQYLNLSRQAERRTLEKLKQQQPRQRSLDKNW